MRSDAKGGKPTLAFYKSGIRLPGKADSHAGRLVASFPFFSVISLSNRLSVVPV